MQLSDQLAMAVAARLKAQSTGLRFGVGRAIVCTSEAAFVGAKIENQCFDPTIWAERIATRTPIAAGERDVVAIAITKHPDERVVVCGAWRQFLAEFTANLVIVRATVGGERRINNSRTFCLTE